MQKITIVLGLLFSVISLMGQNFEVSPLDFYFNAEAGESQTKYLKVKNHNNKVETILLSVSDYQVDSKGEGSYEEAGSLKNSIADWISIAPSFFELQPNEEKEVEVTLQQAADSYGSKWGVIFVRTAQEQTNYSADKALSTGMAVSARIAVSVYQTPGNNSTFRATISNMSEITNSSDSIRYFSALVNNVEDIITPCKVYLIATNIVTAEETTFSEFAFTMYPKSSRKLELEMPNELPTGTYSLAAILDYGSNASLEGVQIVIKVE